MAWMLVLVTATRRRRRSRGRRRSLLRPDARQEPQPAVQRPTDTDVAPAGSWTRSWKPPSRSRCPRCVSAVHVRQTKGLLVDGTLVWQELSEYSPGGPRSPTPERLRLVRHRGVQPSRGSANEVSSQGRCRHQGGLTHGQISRSRKLDDRALIGLSCPAVRQDRTASAPSGELLC